MTVKDLIAKTRTDPGKDYHVEWLSGRPWVFFHASWSLQDWVRDFCCWTVRFAGGRYHAGYVAEFKDMLPGLTVDVENLLKFGKGIVFCGYSRGAALVALAWKYYIAKKEIPTEYFINSDAVGLGLPRISCKYSYIQEIRYGHDLVTYLPPWLWKNIPAMQIPSKNRGLFAAIKDHGSYVDCDVEIDLTTLGAVEPKRSPHEKGK